MKNAMRIAAIGIAAILSAAIAGCSASGVALDREVDVHGLIMSVPSTWVEDESDNSIGDETKFGHTVFENTESETYEQITVSYSNVDLDETLSEITAEEEEGWESMADAHDFECSSIDTFVVDGVEVTTYDKCLYIEGELAEQWQAARFMGSDMHYEIDVHGDSVSLDDLLETISFE